MKNKIIKIKNANLFIKSLKNNIKLAKIAYKTQRQTYGG